MKLKYYMRGLGIGICVTTVILIIAFAFTNNNISDEEIINRAKKLGMVEANTSTISEAKANTTIDNNSSDNNSSDTNGNAVSSNNISNNESETITNNTTDNDVVFTINDGESSRVVIERLQDMGIINDAYSFNKYVNDRGIDNLLQNGTFKIRKGISEEDLANLLITKQQFREST